MWSGTVSRKFHLQLLLSGGLSYTPAANWVASRPVDAVLITRERSRGRFLTTAICKSLLRVFHNVAQQRQIIRD